MEYISELRNGYSSVFKFRCKVCNIEFKLFSEKESDTIMPINKALVNGCIATGN